MELPAAEPAAQRRQHCGRCSRPPSVCVCAALPVAPLRLRHCRVILLQHWREAKEKKIMGTAPIVRLCLEAGSIDVLVDRTPSAAGDNGLTARATAALFPELGRAMGIATTEDEGGPPPAGATALPPLVLFPGPGALPLEGLLHSERQQDPDTAPSVGDSDRRRVLIVLDGTWKQAKQLWWRHRAALSRARRVVLMNAGTSRFEKIRRREPALGCVSTLEALAAALALLERSARPRGRTGAGGGAAAADVWIGSMPDDPESVADALIAAFDELVRVQSRFVPGPLVAEDFPDRRGTSPAAVPTPAAAASAAPALRTSSPSVLASVPRAVTAGGTDTSRETRRGPRVRAYAMCLTRTCPLTASQTLVPVGIVDPGVAARAAGGALSEREALAAGLLWCTQTEAAAACRARNVAERRTRGQRFLSLPACSPRLDWSAVSRGAMHFKEVTQGTIVDQQGHPTTAVDQSLTVVSG